MRTESWLSSSTGALAVAGLALLATGCGKPAGTQTETPATSASPVIPSNPGPTEIDLAKRAAAEMQKLKGRWVRPDGGYILEIKQVDANGQLDAAYFNPDPIRITSSFAKLEGDVVKVFVELNDVNYPGCKYELTYISAAGLMAGTYYQAALQQTFDVAFERAR